MKVRNLGVTRQIGRFGVIAQNALVESNGQEPTEEELKALIGNDSFEILGGWQIVNDEAYLRHPTTGLYHLIKAVIESGTLSFQIDDTGIELP
jgi:hypothetical protein